MPMHQRRTRRLRDVCLHAIDMGTQNIVVRAVNTLQINVDQVVFRNHLKRCVRMRTRTLTMMKQVLLQLIPAHNGVTRWYFVLVLFLEDNTYRSWCFDGLFAWRGGKIASWWSYLGISWDLYYVAMDWIVRYDRVDVVL